LTERALLLKLRARAKLVGFEGCGRIRDRRFVSFDS
jgi:hypothetical protein